VSTLNAVQPEIDRAEFLGFHDARLAAVERNGDACIVRIEGCYLYVRVDAQEVRYDVHDATVELRATSVKGVFLDPDRAKGDWIYEAEFWREAREVDDEALRRGEPFDEVILRFSGADRQLQVIADTIRLVIVHVGPTKLRWFGALDDPNAREEWVAS
jgi:hypothetical protein